MVKASDHPRHRDGIITMTASVKLATNTTDITTKESHLLGEPHRHRQVVDLLAAPE